MRSLVNRLGCSVSFSTGLFRVHAIAMQARLGCSLFESRRYCSNRSPTKSVDDDADDGFTLNATDILHRQVAQANASANSDALVAMWLPDNAPQPAKDKVLEYLRSHPVDNLIQCSSVLVTHIEENGEEKKVNVSEMPLEDAIESAKERGLSVVQMGERDGLAYVRFRNEKNRVLSLVAAELAEIDNTATQSIRLKKATEHVFRDVVDAHFIGWKSKKIVEDLKKLHPVKVGVNQFQTAESAVSKLREMCNAMKQHAEATGVYHHFTSINTSDKEVAILFSPSVQGKNNSSKSVKHPGEKEWNHTANRLGEVLRKSGRSGTYSKAEVLTPRNMGALPYRVDKYGRRIA